MGLIPYGLFRCFLADCSVCCVFQFLAFPKYCLCVCTCYMHAIYLSTLYILMHFVLGTFIYYLEFVNNSTRIFNFCSVFLSHTFPTCQSKGYQCFLNHLFSHPCVCLYVYICVYVHICACVGGCACICVFAYVYVHMCIYGNCGVCFICVSTYVCSYMCIC